MTNSNSRRVSAGFKCTLHFLRGEGEHSYEISAPIVAFEDENGNFYPRRPEPGEAHIDGRSFDTLEELTAFLWDRERNHINHDALWHNEHFLGISPFYEFICRPEKVAPHGAYGCNSGWCFENFQRGVTLEIANFRHWALFAAEVKYICTAGNRVQEPSANGDLYEDAAFIAGTAQEVQRHRWREPRAKLPAGTPQYYRSAQLWRSRSRAVAVART